MIRVVLLGKTGAGKSSLGNTLIGRDVFQVARGMASGTETCQWAEETRDGMTLQVTDTPGLCDTHRDESDVLREVGKSVAVASPGPHVVLMVLRCDRRFTEEEFQAYLALKGLFGEGVCGYMIVVFAGADAYGDSPDEQRQNLKMEAKKFPPELQQVIREAGGRFLPVNNRGSRQDRNQQAKEIVAAMNGLVEKNGGRCFTSKLTEEVDKLKHPILEQRKAERKNTLEEANRDFNNAIVHGNEHPGFIETISRMFHNALMEISIQIAGNTRRVSGSSCSMM